MPVPEYSGLMADSPVALPRTALPNRSPTPFTPVDTATSPIIHCMAPAEMVTGDWLKSHTS